ncbi:MAG TPA: sigma-54-dependent Fis family transcriptional regulator [Firmicutes bacterium]|jgi:PAS domain S-box-containing protein|nr:sigma-54-dependent Fis family transcriptional regulator [Bacillota bacterium]
MKAIAPNYHLQVILDAIHDGLVAIDRQGKIVLLNPAAAEILGVQRDHAMDKPVGHIIPNSRMLLVLETGEPEINQRQELANKTILTSRLPVRDTNAAIIGAVAVFRNISEIKKLAEEITNLREIQSMLEAIINATQDAISVVDSQGRGILVNPAYKRITGYVESDVLGKPATVDIAQGESVHLQVLSSRLPVKGIQLKVGSAKKDVLVDGAPILVNDELKGSVAVIHDISEIKRLNEELDKAKQIIRTLEAKYDFKDIIATSPKMLEVVEQARKAANTPATILLLGESGTGKELFAHAIHNSSQRKHNQFIRVNCAALTGSLLESELFGYSDGAFTGARRGGKKGLFEQAGGGTIFLDEIGEISLGVQAKLLRVLQEKEIVRVGDAKQVSVDVRIIAATNIDLEEAVATGKFREDLYYRIRVIPLYIPPLRERLVEIPALARRLLGKFNQEYGRVVEDIAPDVLKVLQKYSWPGNVRELENILGRAIINMRFNETCICREHLPQFTAGPHTMPVSVAENDASVLVQPLGDVLADFEKDYIALVLKENQGNKTRAAKAMEISLRSLYYKLDKYGL